MHRKIVLNNKEQDFILHGYSYDRQESKEKIRNESWRRWWRLVVGGSMTVINVEIRWEAATTPPRYAVWSSHANVYGPIRARIVSLSAALQSLWSSNSSHPRLGIGRANKAASRSIPRTRGFGEGKSSNRDHRSRHGAFLPPSDPPPDHRSEIRSINNHEWSTVAAKIRAKLVNRELWIDRGRLDPFWFLWRRWFLSQSFTVPDIGIKFWRNIEFVL